MIFDRLQHLISNQLDIPKEKITLNSNIKNEFDFDSLDIAELIMNIEDEFSIKISNDKKIFDCQTIQEIIYLIENKLKEL